MRRDLNAIWLVARREVIDQVRDWRIVVPMILLVSLFPFIADSTTRQAIGFMNRFGGGLILDNLDPNLLWYLAGTVSLISAIGFMYLKRMMEAEAAKKKAISPIEQKIQQK